MKVFCNVISHDTDFDWYVFLNLDNKYDRQIVQDGLRRFDEGKRYTHMVWGVKILRMTNANIWAEYQRHKSQLMMEFAHDYRKES